jgi:hypothetical protein
MNGYKYLMEEYKNSPEEWRFPYKAAANWMREISETKTRGKCKHPLDQLEHNSFAGSTHLLFLR